MMCSDVIDDIIAEREVAAAEARKERKKPPPINLTNADLGRVVNGRPTDRGKKRPFSYAFSVEKVDQAWNSVGAIGKDGWVTCQALSHPKVLAGAAADSSTANATSSAFYRQAVASAAAANEQRPRRQSAPLPSAPVPAAANEQRPRRQSAPLPSAPVPAHESPPKAHKSPPRTRVDVAAANIAAHEAAMQALKALGAESTVFEVVPKVAKPKAAAQAKNPGKQKAAVTPVDVADPTANEIELAEELDSGTGGFAVWRRGHQGGMWCDDVIGPVLKRLRADKEQKAANTQKRDEDFERLREQAIDVVDACISIEMLPIAKLTVLTRYVFSAMGIKNVTKVTGDRDAMLINLMDKLNSEQLLKLLDDPFKSSGAAVPSDWPTLYIPSAKGQASSSAESAYTTFADKFGFNALELATPDLDEIEEGLLPIAQQPWLKAHDPSPRSPSPPPRPSSLPHPPPCSHVRREHSNLNRSRQKSSLACQLCTSSRKMRGDGPSV